MVRKIAYYFTLVGLYLVIAPYTYGYRGEFDDKYDPSSDGPGLIPTLIFLGILFAIWRSGTKK